MQSPPNLAISPIDRKRPPALGLGIPPPSSVACGADAPMVVPKKVLGTAIHELVRHFGGVEVELPQREQMHELLRLD